MLSGKLFVLISFAATMVLVEPSDRLVGGVSNLSGDDLKDAEQTLQNSLSKLAAGEGPNYKIGKVHSASRQVVAGVRHTYNVDLIDSNGAVKQCNVDILSQLWLPNGIQVTIDCEGEEKVVRKHSA